MEQKQHLKTALDWSGIFQVAEMEWKQCLYIKHMTMEWHIVGGEMKGEWQLDIA